ncbi:MAG: hypothetical protein U5O39_19075 [Gammaproteobacteria bacterium]|nr:hypothetical protein [Gammaproteobacteria bacterium]
MATSVLDVDGRTRFDVRQDGELTLTGENNRLAEIEIEASSVDLNLSGDSLVARIAAEESVALTADGRVSIGEEGSDAIRINQDLTVNAPNVVFVAGSDNQIGGLSVTTGGEQGDSVEIRSSINPRIIGGNLTNQDGSIKILSPQVTIGAPEVAVSLVTSGESGVGGRIEIQGVDSNGSPIPGGEVLLAGDVTFDTTNGGASGGADVVVMSDGTEGGTIRAEDPNVATSLTILTGDGITDLGNFVEQSATTGSAEVDSLTILADGAVTLDDVFVGADDPHSFIRLVGDYIGSTA